MLDIHVVDLISSGSSQTLVRQSIGLTPRLFYGSDLYIYNIESLYKVYNLSTLSDVSPDGMTRVSAITSISNGVGSNTIALGPIGAESALGDAVYGLKYTAYPETGMWSSGSALPSGFAPVDSESDYDGSINALTGNSYGGTAPRVMASSGSAPYPMSASDTGIPKTPIPALITDIEIAK